jgi:hypothetical protein
VPKRLCSVFSEQTPTELKHLPRHSIALLGTLDDNRRELRKIRRRRAVADIHNFLDTPGGPIIDHAIQNLCPLSKVACTACVSQRLQPDPVARCLIAKRGTPAANVEHLALTGTSHHIRSGSGHGEYARLSRKRRVQSNFLIAAHDNLAARASGENLPHPAIRLRQAYPRSAHARCGNFPEIHAALS